MQRLPGVATAVFPTGPERVVYENALLQRDLNPTGRADALDAMENGFAAAGVTRFAGWNHDSNEAMRTDLQRRGYTLDAPTRAMGLTLDAIRLPDGELAIDRDRRAHLRSSGLP